jgi:serine protease inhibitor
MLRPFFGWMTGILAAALSASLAGCGSNETTPPIAACNAAAGSGTNCCGSGACAFQPAGPPAVVQAFKAETPVDPAIVTADNTFGLNLLNTLLQQGASSTGNTAIAPVSVSLALQIAYNGAAGTTQQAMSQTLQLGGLTTQQLNDDNAALQASLILVGLQSQQLTVANSLWTNSDIAVVPAFIQANQNYYGATLGSLAGAPDNVNQWVSQQTNGLITNILPAGDYSKDVGVIANVVYFKAQWQYPFQTSQTTAQPFTLGDSTQTTAQMMHQAGTFPYLQGSGFQAIRLPYGAGRLSMLVVLPTTGTDINTFVSGITATTVDSWESQLQSVYGNVALPHFSTSFNTSLKNALTTLGMGVAFMPNDADFSGIAPLTYLSHVAHATVVDVDENGTVAAGATTVTVGYSVVQDPAFSVTADHPFFYAIRDDQTGELLFVGVMANPNGG